MNCFYCKGVDTVEEQPTRFCACESPQPFVVENVPAAVCRLCGDRAFSAETVAALEKIKNGEAQARGYQVIQIFDFEQPGRAEKPEIVMGKDQPLLRHYAQYLDQNRVTVYGSISSWAPGVVYPMVIPKFENPAMQYIAGIKLGDALQGLNLTFSDSSPVSLDQEYCGVGITWPHSNGQTYQV
jgi:hypothetical protein